LLDTAYLRHIYERKEKCNDQNQGPRLHEKLKKNKWHVHTALPFKIHKTRKKKSK